MTEQERVIEKLAKIKRHAESAKEIGSDAEAEAFAAALQKMLLDNKLSMTDLEFAEFEKEQPVGFHRIDYTQYPDVTLRKKRTEWIELLSNIIADAHFCRIVVHPNSSRISLIGRAEDAAVAEYLIMTLTRAAEKLSEKAYGDYTVECVNECARCGRKREEHRRVGKEALCPHANFYFVPNWAKARGFKGSYLRAFIARLFQRFEAERKAREAQSTALVRINTAKAAVEAFMEERYPKKGDKASKLSGNVRYNREGVKRGSAAADSIELRPNVLNGSAQKTRLIS